LLVLPLGASAMAQASTRPAVPESSTLPADCTLNTQGTAPAPITYSLTCTDRPASQQWAIGLWGARWRGGFYLPGNTVTGDGTSTVITTQYGSPEGNAF
jgi:hypothetical protein